MKIVVASTNPVKINATKAGFARMFPNITFRIKGVPAKSDVSDQPISEEETLRGAMNRANNVSLIETRADYWVGIEGGSEIFDGEMKSFTWIVVKSKDGKFGKARTGSYFLPEKISELIKQGKELGEADDIVFGLKNSKQANGTIGILSGDVITRTTLYEQAVILALIPFKNPDLY